MPGPATFAAYQAGKIDVGDLAVTRYDARRGQGGSVRSLKEAPDAHPVVMARDAKLSQHPADRLIRQRLRTGRPATAGEIDQIIRRMATAPFPTAEAHRNAHTADRQWDAGTTVGQYVDDLIRAINDPETRLAIYLRRGGNMAAVLTETQRVVAAARRGIASVPLLFVAHSAGRSTMATGYQASSLGLITLPGDVRWLR